MQKEFPMKNYIMPLMTVLSLNTAQARTDTRNYALQPLSTTLTEDLVSMGTCSAEQLERLSARSYPKSPTGGFLDSTESPLPFLLGICYAHQKEPRIETIYRGIESLQSAVTRGLMPSQKSAAALFEGLQHCRAATFYDKTRDTLLRDKDLFCQHRSMAREAFSEVNWFQLNMQYESSVRDVTNLSNEMAQCGAEILASKNDAECSVITALDQQAVQDIAAKAVAEVLPHFIETSSDGPSHKPSLPPFTAMLSRKLTLTNEAMARIGQDLSAIKADSDALSDDARELVQLYGSYDETNDLLEIGADTLPEKIAGFKDRYLLAVAKARALLELAQRWEDGLTTGGDLSNKATALLRQITELNNQLKYIKENEASKDSLFNAVVTVRDNIKILQGGDQQRQKKVVGSLCALYYCDLKGLNAASFQKICRTKIQGTTTSYFEYNPLCDNPTNPDATGILKGANSSQTKVADLCRAHGFDARYIKTALDDASAEACLASQFDPFFWGRSETPVRGR
jgi:hypothetical protein